MSRATDKKMDALHGLLADTLASEIERARASGEGVPANLLAQAIKFLKDNGIDSPGVPSEKLDRLSKSLPSLEDLDDSSPLPN